MSHTHQGPRDEWNACQLCPRYRPTKRRCTKEIDGPKIGRHVVYDRKRCKAVEKKGTGRCGAHQSRFS